MKTWISKNAEETALIAREIADLLHGGDVLELEGDLGAGKTTFTKGLVAALGGGARVKSPTFTVMNEYEATHVDIKRVVHIDFYRFNDDLEAMALALEDERRADTLIVAEWPSKVSADFLRPTKTLRFEHLRGDERRITLS